MKNLALLFIVLLINIVLSAQKSSLYNTSVFFTTSDSGLQKLYNRAETLAAENIIQYGNRKVLKEGAKYVSIWLETQPMGGYMYAKRNLEIAKNNVEIFMDYQREDGRLPGVIYNKQGVITPNYAQFQGLYFAMPAYELYFILNKDKTFLKRVYKSLEAFDTYLWKNRDSDKDGCLESWCIFDTGEDENVRFNGYPRAWDFEFPPTKESISKLSKEELITRCKQKEFDSSNEMTVPIESMDVMSYSYSCRHVLSLISQELKNGKTDYWNNQALLVKAKIKSYLWDDKKKACFDRDKYNKTMPILLHNNLRCMYFGSFDQNMADNFIKYHLINPEEFWTPMPLPSIAANDPNFENISGNNWSGQPQALTYQRAISALENYGHYAELTILGSKFLDIMDDSLKFTQQFDPFKSTINNSKDGYGPSILTTLELIGRFYGVHITQDKIYWSCLDKEYDYNYTQNWNGNTYHLETKGKQVICSINDKILFSFSKGARLTTDLNGNLIEIVGIDTEKKAIQYKNQKEYSVIVKPNTTYKLNDNDVFKKFKSYIYFQPLK